MAGVYGWCFCCNLPILSGHESRFGAWVCVCLLMCERVFVWMCFMSCTMLGVFDLTSIFVVITAIAFLLVVGHRWWHYVGSSPLYFISANFMSPPMTSMYIYIVRSTSSVAMRRPIAGEKWVRGNAPHKVLACVASGYQHCSASGSWHCLHQITSTSRHQVLALHTIRIPALLGIRSWHCTA